MSFTLSIPDLSDGSAVIELRAGSSTFLVGANGSGKTRLAVEAEQQWGENAHRISAHRALNLNPNVSKTSEHQALYNLRFGSATPTTGLSTRDISQRRKGNRWHGKAETLLLNDFDLLVQALFGDQSNIALKTHTAAHAGTLDKPDFTHFQTLAAIWARVLPHRALQVTGDDIRASTGDQQPYSAAEMSDGERAIFYIIGQVLVSAENSILIFDEPELHIHRAILSRLWDEVEAARPDCAFLVITHDLEFAASRPGQKFAIRRYQPLARWQVERIPEDSGFSEELATLILGSRQPILFVEGTGSSLDLAIYRACYPDWTVLARGACENVIHSVVTMRHNSSLTRTTCSGIVDADDYNHEEKDRLATLGVAVLPVSEIENLFLLPSVAAAILEGEGFLGTDLQSKLDVLRQDLILEVSKPGSINEVVLRYCRRRIDRTLKKIDLKDAATPAELATAYAERTLALDVAAVAAEFRIRIESAIERRDIPALLANFDNKALLALAAKHLKGISRSAFGNWLTRTMRTSQENKLKSALGAVLPSIVPH